MDKLDNWEIEAIQKGFNQGYLLAKHRPEFIDHLKNDKNGASKIPYFNALLEGAKQYEQDKQREMQKSKDKSKTLDKQPPTKQAPKTPTKGR